jgi:chitin disaccharide deacetylase
MRQLFVVADDFGLGPETSRAILELGTEQLLSGTTLLVTSEHARAAVQAWNSADKPLSLGWHPCLTMDRPLSADVPSLVDAEGRFHPLGTLLKKLFTKKINRADVEREMGAQYQRYIDLVGSPPELINGHHHIHIFEPIRSVLLHLLNDTKPYLRRVTEPMRCFWRMPGVRWKRRFLSWMGTRSAKHQLAYPGADELLGITDPPFVGLPGFFPNWLRCSRAATVELMVHPGYPDSTVVGRDDGQTDRRATELAALRDPAFRAAVAECGFVLERGFQRSG